MKPSRSCTVVLVNLSTSRAEGAGAVLWSEVVATAAIWWGGDWPQVRAWLRLVRVCLEAPCEGDLEALCREAERCRVIAAWPIAWAVRAATAACVVEARRAGVWPAWRALPFALSLRVHPLSLAEEVLEESARAGGRDLEVARVAWRELAARHGVVA